MKLEAQKQFVEVMSHRMHIDNSVKMVGKLLFGIDKGPEVLNAVRPAGQPLVDDWDCLKTLVNFQPKHFLSAFLLMLITIYCSGPLIHYSTFMQHLVWDL